MNHVFIFSFNAIIIPVQIELESHHFLEPARDSGYLTKKKKKKNFSLLATCLESQSQGWNGEDLLLYHALVNKITNLINSNQFKSALFK